VVLRIITKALAMALAYTIKILLILAISDDPERVFLGGCYTVLWDRMCHSAAMK